MPKTHGEQGIYQVVDRLLALRDLLRTEPQTREQIAKQLPEDYSSDEGGWRKLRRDLHYLELWGYQVVRNKAAKSYFLSRPAIESDWTDEELEALAAVRESFKAGLPYSSTIQAILGRIEQGLDSKRRKLFARKPPLTIRLATVEKMPPGHAAQKKLEEAIRQCQRISFKYRPLGSHEATIHPDDEPMTIEFRDEHYYLVAYCYEARRLLEYRVDQIVPGSVRILPKRAEGNWKRQVVNFKYRLSPLLATRGVTPRFEMLTCDIQADGSTIVTAQGYGDFWIIREILRYGEQAEILGPPALREQIKRKVEQMMAVYSRDETVPDEDEQKRT